MPLPTLSSLLSGATPTQMKQVLVNLWALAGFPSTAWQAFSVPRRLLEGEGSTLADLANTIAKVAAGGLALYASGPWIDLLAQNLYNTSRKPAVFTQGQFVLQDGGGGPFTITPGVTRFKNPLTGNVYVVAPGGGGTLPLNGQFTVTVQAVAPGSAYNDPSNAPIALVTSLPGVTVTNPAIGTTGTWITQRGTDAESDDLLRTRLLSQWPTLGGGATPQAILNWCLNASPEIVRVQVLTPQTDNSMPDGHVSVILAGAGGGVSGTARSAAVSYVGPRLPICVTGPSGTVDSAFTSATNVPLNILGAPRVKAANLATAQAKANQNLIDLFAGLPLGDGVHVVLYVDQIREAILAADPTITTSGLTSPIVDQNPSLGQVLTLGTVELTWTTY